MRHPSSTALAPGSQAVPAGEPTLCVAWGNVGLKVVEGFLKRAHGYAATAALRFLFADGTGPVEISAFGNVSGQRARAGHQGAPVDLLSASTALLHRLLETPAHHRKPRPIHLIGVGTEDGLAPFSSLAAEIRRTPALASLARHGGGIRAFYLLVSGKVEREVRTWWLVNSERFPGIGVALVCVDLISQIRSEDERIDEATCALHVLSCEASEEVVQWVLPPPDHLHRLTIWWVEDGLKEARRARALKDARELIDRVLRATPGDMTPDPAISFMQAWNASKANPLKHATLAPVKVFHEGLSRLEAIREDAVRAVIGGHVQASAITDEGWSGRVQDALDREVAARLSGVAEACAARVLELVAREADGWAKAAEAIQQCEAGEIGLDPLHDALTARMKQLGELRPRLGSTEQRDARTPPGSEGTSAELAQARARAAADLERLPPENIFSSWYLAPILLIGALVAPILLAFGQALGPPDPGAASTLLYLLHRHLVNPLVTAPGAVVAGLVLTWLLFRQLSALASRRIRDQVAEHLAPRHGSLARAIAAAGRQHGARIADARVRLLDLVENELTAHLDRYIRATARLTADIGHTRDCARWLRDRLAGMHPGVPGPEQESWTLQPDVRSQVRYLLVPPHGIHKGVLEAGGDSSRAPFWEGDRRPDDTRWADTVLLWPEHFLDEVAQPEPVSQDPVMGDFAGPCWGEFHGYTHAPPSEADVTAQSFLIVGQEFRGRVQKIRNRDPAKPFPPKERFKVLTARESGLAVFLHVTGPRVT